jgi:hypothetical protein
LIAEVDERLSKTELIDQELHSGCLTSGYHQSVEPLKRLRFFHKCHSYPQPLEGSLMQCEISL